jgi:hypothetical protein
LLSATEEALAALRAPGANLHHASVALRVVPGEYDEHLSGPLSAAARAVAPLRAQRSVAQLRADLARLDVALQESLNHLDALGTDEDSVGMQKAGELARFLLRRLRGGWNESGLWSPAAIDEDNVAEAEAVQNALRTRLYAIERAARMSAGPLTVIEGEQFEQMFAGLIDKHLAPGT